MANKDEILQTILIHNGLYKRKVFLDSLSEGLEIYKIHSLMKIFPNLFKPVFTSSELSGTDIIQKIVPCAVSLDDHMLQLISCLFEYITELSPDGMSTRWKVLVCTFNNHMCFEFYLIPMSINCNNYYFYFLL